MTTRTTASAGEHDYGSTNHMKAIIRRLRKLEERFGPPVETESTRRLRKRIEAGLRRLAEARERGEWCGSIAHEERENLTGLSVTEILHRGRTRLLARAIERLLARAIERAPEGNRF